jgi:hypothetical protein
MSGLSSSKFLALSAYKPPKKPRGKAGTKLAKTAIKHRCSIHGKQNTTSSVHLWHLQVQTNNNLQRIKARMAA